MDTYHYVGLYVVWFGGIDKKMGGSDAGGEEFQELKIDSTEIGK